MKKRESKSYLSALALLVFLVFSLSLQAETRIDYLTQDFTGTAFPPAGWTISSNPTNWGRNNSNNAGGTAPELRFNWSPEFIGTSYFISPQVDLTGLTSVYLKFRQFVDHFGAGYSVRVATRSNNGPWTNVWSVTPSGNVGPELRTIHITNTDVNNSTFQFAFVFDGNSYQIDYWYIDNIRLYYPNQMDVEVLAVQVNNQIAPFTSIVPSALVGNAGLTDAAFQVTCNAYVYNDVTPVYTSTVPASIAVDQTATLNFASFVPEIADELYKFEVVADYPGDMDANNNLLIKWVNTYTTPRDKVVLEIGTGTWCQYCPGAAMGASDLITNGRQVAVIKNHNGTSDPYTNDFSNNRNTYYGITGFPTAVFDGLLKYVGGSNTQSMYNNYLPLYNQRYPIKTPGVIGIFGENTSGNNYSLNIIINRTGRVNFTNLVLHVFLTESNIAYNWQGQTQLHNVNRLMVPGVNGTPIDLVNNEYLNIPLTFVKNTAWVTNNCELVAFIQNNATKEVLQGAKIALTALVPVSVDEALVMPKPAVLHPNYPNPFSRSTTISYTLNKSADVTIDIYNIKGQHIRKLVNAEMPKGNHKIVWDGKDKSNNDSGEGLYIIKLKSGQTDSSHKMILLK